MKLKGSPKSMNVIVMAAIGVALAAIIIATAEGGLETILTRQIEKSVN